MLKKNVVERPWGKFEVIELRDDHNLKRVSVYPGKRLSLQRHERRNEHWVIISGKALATVGENEISLSAGSWIDIHAGTNHRISNIGDVPLVFIEVQTGSYFGEDDIIRIEDDFMRV